MKKTPLLFFCLAAAGAFAGGCGHLDLESQTNSTRVLTGKIEIGENDHTPLPSDAVVLVRVMDPYPNAASATPQVPVETGTMLKRPAPQANPPPEELGGQTIDHPDSFPIKFSVDYTATDDQLRRGVDVEVRISYHNKVRYSNLSHVSVGLDDFTQPHTVLVNQAQ